MLQYEFMQKAFLVAVVLALIIPCIGSFLVFKRLSMMGDALSHASLSGVAIGLLVHYNPLLGAFVSCLFAACLSEFLRKRTKYSEISLVIISSFGVGLAGVLSSFIRNATSFHSFLFGSIVAISKVELYSILSLGLCIFLAFLYFYQELFYIAFDEEGAKVAGIPVEKINYFFILLTATVVAIASRSVGALMTSSFLVLPIASAMQLARSYKMTIVLAVIFAQISSIGGLFTSYYFGLKPGGSIVLLSVFLFLISLALKNLKK